MESPIWERTKQNNDKGVNREHSTDFLMDSIDPECTQLKHIYEACFQKWYTAEYLPATEDRNIEGNTNAVISNNSKTSIFKASTQPTKNTNPAISHQTQQKYKEVAQSYETQCGTLFTIYRGCLEKALKSRKVDVMLTEHHLNEESTNKLS